MISTRKKEKQAYMYKKIENDFNKLIYPENTFDFQNAEKSDNLCIVPNFIFSLKKSLL